jgi:hypothetical protein
MDELRVGPPGAVTTYDVEGLQTQVTIAREPGRSDDDEVTIIGRLRTLTGDPIPHATMVLERRDPGSKVWEPVQVADVSNGGVRATVRNDERAFYRWRFVERPMAEGNASVALLLELLPTLPTDPPSPTPSSTPSTPSSPTAPASPTATEPTGSTSESASEPASASASASASGSTSSPTDATDESASPSESDSHGTR